MALGKIKADTLEHSTAGSLDTQYVVNGSAKAWVNFNQASVDDSHNVSSVTDSDVGRFVVNLSNSMGNTGYAISVCARNPVGSGADFKENNDVARATGTTPVVTLSAGSYYDSSDAMVIFQGDLA